MKRKMQNWTLSPGQELLLRSALSEPDEAIRSWGKWKISYDINNLDKGSYRLLPMVFCNLKDLLDPKSELYEKLKGTYRKSWFSNNMIMETAAVLFSDLRNSGINPVLLKGVHLINSYYDEGACRPIGDADFLVNWNEAEKAGEMMKARGWKLIEKHRYPVFKTNFMSLRRSVGFFNKKGYRCDLHWNIFSHRCYPDADIDLLRRGVDFKMKNSVFRGLCPEDLFVHVMEHGAYFNPEPNIRWIPDSLIIIDKSVNLDWDLVLHNIVMINLQIPFRNMLGYLHDTFGNKDVLYLLSRLEQHPVSERGRELYRRMCPARTLLGHQIKFFLRSYLNYKIFLTESVKGPLPKGIPGFVRFLKFRWGISNNALFPFVFMKKFFSKIARYSFRS